MQVDTITARNLHKRAVRPLVLLCVSLAVAGCVQTGSGTFEPPPTPPRTAPIPPVQTPAGRPASTPASPVPAASAPGIPAALPPARNAATGVTGRGSIAIAGLGAASAMLLSSANQHAASGDLASAAADVEHALRLEPAQPRLWIELGELRLRQGQRDQARNMARKALTLVGNDAALGARVTELLRRTGG